MAIALAMLISGQPQQQQSPNQNVPDAPAPQAANPLGDLKSQIAPGKSTSPGTGQSSDAPASPAPAVQPPKYTPEQLAEPDPEILPAPGQGPESIAKAIRVVVNFVEVPVTVKDARHQLVPGLTFRDFKIYENNQQQRITLFTVDPVPLSVAFVIDQSVKQDTMQKVNTALSAITGALAPYDEAAVFTYNNGPQEITSFTAAQGTRLPAALEIAKSKGRDMNVAVNSGPLANGPIINGQPVDPNLSRGTAAGTFITIPKEIHTLNDAIFRAAEALQDRPKGRRRVIYVISDGKEAGSKVSEKEVIRYLLTNKISTYGTVVGDSATWGEGYLDRIHLPLLPKNNILPRYTIATGGHLDSELSTAGIERSFSHITEEIRTQYTLGYVSHEPVIDGKYRKINVDVLRPNLDVSAKDGYYPSAQDARP